MPKKILKLGFKFKLPDFKQGHLILAGDFNFSMDHGLDNTSPAPCREIEQLRLIKKKSIVNNCLTYGE